MTFKELKNQANVLKDNANVEVRLINASIEDDEACPTFEILNVSAVRYRGKNLLLLEYEDTDYVKDEYVLPPREDFFYKEVD